MPYTIDPKDPEALLHVLGEASIEFNNAGHFISQSIVDELRDQLRAQVKPPIDEPEAFGSLVHARERYNNAPLLLWQKCPERGKHYWMSETGAVEVWSELTDVEVLRVGLEAP